MDRLTAAIYARLSGDAELTSTLGAVVTQGTLKEDPKILVQPKVVFRVAGAPDRTGYHGASVSARVEVKVWGYQDNAGADLPECLAVGQRVDELMLAKLATTDTGGSPDGGGTARPQSNPGWQQLEQPDPMVIHLHNGYDILYWSAQRVAAL